MGGHPLVEQHHLVGLGRGGLAPPAQHLQAPPLTAVLGHVRVQVHPFVLSPVVRRAA
ncbi:hypothetical protein ACFQZ4_19890 [Catellatospora coxensis]